MILPQTLPLIFQGLAVYFLLSAIWTGSDSESVIQKTQKAVFDFGRHSCKSLLLMLPQKNKANATETTSIFRGFASRIRL